MCSAKAKNHAEDQVPLCLQYYNMFICRAFLLAELSNESVGVSYFTMFVLPCFQELLVEDWPTLFNHCHHHQPHHPYLSFFISYMSCYRLVSPGLD
jgi:hypothetical protein